MDNPQNITWEQKFHHKTEIHHRTTSTPESYLFTTLNHKYASITSREGFLAKITLKPQENGSLELALPKSLHQLLPTSLDNNFYGVFCKTIGEISRFEARIENKVEAFFLSFPLKEFGQAKERNERNISQETR